MDETGIKEWKKVSKRRNKFEISTQKRHGKREKKEEFSPQEETESKNRE